MTTTLDGLIREVRAGSDDVLIQLQAASRKAGELDELGDALLTHFVDRCRRAGRTWAEIGEHLGVTRQAAQKRFVDTIGEGVSLDRFTTRARHAMDRAQEVASSLDHNYLGTEHQLLALFDIEGGLAGRVLSELGVSRGAVERSVLAVVPRGAVSAAGLARGSVAARPFTPRARKVLEEAVNVSVELGHSYVGTEHLLLGLYRGQEGVAMQVLDKLGATREATRAKVIELLVRLAPK